MIADADRAKYVLPQKPPGKITLIERADAAVDIRDILQDMGVWTPSGDFYSYKIWCPWHYEHADQTDKNCRLFGSTNIYCWAQHGYITPTYLYSRWKHIPREKAAIELLDERGLLNKPWREKWNDLVDERDDKQHRDLGSKNEFLAALNLALARHPEYVENEFSGPVRAKWQTILQGTDNLWTMPSANLEMLNIFFDACLTALLDSAKIVDRAPEEH